MGIAILKDWAQSFSFYLQITTLFELLLKDEINFYWTLINVQTYLVKSPVTNIICKR